MHKFMILPLSILLIFSTGGCSVPAENKSAAADKSSSTSLTAKSIEVIVEGGGQFPKFLAGRWTGPEGWEFNFEPNGLISTAIFTLGRVTLRPGQITRVPMKMGGEGVFEPGQWLVHYDHSNQELTVKVSLKHFTAQLGDSVLEGKTTDIFIGPVSKDWKIWQTVWTSLPEFTAHTPELPNYNLPVHDANGEVREVVFEKATGPRMITIE
jgi:hypothetical protein